MPWSGMRIVEDSEAGTLVEIPKFYYKWTRNGSSMKLQISENSFDGSFVSPAHSDRGDGSGERDYVYVGRYHCSTSNYKSTSGVKPKVSITRATARSSIHGLGSSIWQLDYAMWWTVNMLYLVEFADWDAQAKIGYGSGDGSSSSGVNSGSTNNMLYHTGTAQRSRSIYGVGVQYRYIEDWWANVLDWIDGIYFKTRASVYCILNPSEFSDNTGGTYTGQSMPKDVSGQASYSDGCITEWNSVSVSGYEYSIFPKTYDRTQRAYSTYVTDRISKTNPDIVSFGGGYLQQRYQGPFYLFCGASSRTESSWGCRLMKLP